MMQPTNFTDFNPLDVLAAAASLQRRTEDSAEDEENNQNHKTGSGTSTEGDDDTQDGTEDDDGGTVVDKTTISCEVSGVSIEDQSAPEEQTVDEQECNKDDGESVKTEAAPAPIGDTETAHVEPAEAKTSEFVQVPDGSSTGPLPVAVSTGGTMKIPLLTKYDRAAVPITPPPVHRVLSATMGVNGARTSHMVTDHSYAFVTQLQSLKAEEDEGYSSRSSLDDEGDETVSRLNHKNAQFLTCWAGWPSSALRPHKVVNIGSVSNNQTHLEQPADGTEASLKQPTKIVIASKDSKLQRMISGMGMRNENPASLSGSSSGTSIMLRTLLGEKAGAKTVPSDAQSNQSKVVITGGLSGNVNSGIVLAPPVTSTELIEHLEEPEVTSLLTNVKSVLKSCANENNTGNSEQEEPVDADSGLTSSTADATGTQVDHDHSAQAGLVHSDCGAHGLTASFGSKNATDNLLPIASRSEGSSRHGSEVVTEDDETSCDSSKCDIMVDTTPVMSPNMDFTSPLMSPVCERDIPMMSPMVGSPEIMCDLFKLPSCVKQHSLQSDCSPSPSEDYCNLNVGCVIDEHIADPAAGTVSGVPIEHEQNASTKSELQSPDKASKGICTDDIERGDESVTEQQGASNSQFEDKLAKDSTEYGDLDNQPNTAESLNLDQSGLLDVAIPTPPPTPSAVIVLSGNLQDSTGIPEASEAQTSFPHTNEELSPPTIFEHQVIQDARSTGKNQYIIEDDESPVAKFGMSRSTMDDSIGDSSGNSQIMLAITSTQATANLKGVPEPMLSTSTDHMLSQVKATPVTKSVKVIMTPETSAKSVFTAVRRPVVTGMKAIPGSLHMVPVVPNTNATSALVHMLPMSGTRGLVTQIIPKTNTQFITSVPVLSGKTVVLPDNSKGRMNTLLVPVTISGNTNNTAPISLVQTPAKSKLINLQQATLKGVDLNQEAETILSRKTKHGELSSPLIFHGRITPISTTSDTSDLLSSPESSLHDTFSGLLGRKTPDSPQPTGRMSLENSKDKISLKICSNNVMESDDSLSSELSYSKKETIGIGMMGSLSWKNIEPCASRGLTPIGVGGSVGREFVRIQGSELRTGIHVSDEDSLPPLEKTVKKHGRVPKNHDNKGSLYSRKRNKLLVADPTQTVPLTLPGSENYVPQVTQLHPLIDHDYCMFTEFNAQIQSSIIATTESKTKIEKKYAKKTKVIRSKAVRGLMTEESLKSVSRATVEKIINKSRRGRLKKRRLSKDKATTDEEVSLDGTEESEESVLPIQEKITKKLMEMKPSRTSERRAKLQALKDDKNYVKITGSYQDEFVYFATKNKRNRPRKSVEDQNSQLLKKQQVGGMAVFDWYRDLSKGDKTSRFGTPTTSCPSSPVPSFGGHLDARGMHVSTPSTLATSETSATGILGKPSTSSEFTPPGETPIHEAIEVANLVNDLAEMSTLGSSVTTATNASDIDLSSFIIGTSEAKADVIPTPPGSMAEMAEQVREMLNSMGADELENLELKFGGDDPAVNAITDSTFEGLLGGYAQETVAPIVAQSTTNNLCDLDDINNSDLLQSDLGTLLGVKQPTGTQKPSGALPAAQSELIPTSEANTSCFTKPLDKTLTSPSTAPRSADVSTLAAQTAPELTVVSMYWNDLPGLVIMGQQYVRLVDIHKQVLPAKDTGILKKRCQMMGLSIANCSELQRDFLVRYANAAKSKSTVIVVKEAAQTLIGFYVEPKSRPSKQAMAQRGLELAAQARAKAQATARQAAPPVASSSVSRPQSKSTRPSQQQIPVPANKGTSTIRRKRRLKCASTSEVLTPRSPEVLLSSNEVKRSARLRHKKVCYSDMLLGNHYEQQDRKDDDNYDMPVNSSEDDINSPVLCATPEKNEDTKKSDRLLFPEDIEIMRLKNIAKYDCLNPKEKRKLRRLREKVRKREMKRKLRERRKMAKGRKKGNVMALALAKMAVKTQQKLQQTQFYNRKHNQEHCYAAPPESPPENKLSYKYEQIPKRSAVGIDNQHAVNVVTEAVHSVPLVQIKIEPDMEVNTSLEEENESNPLMVDAGQITKDSVGVEDELEEEAEPEPELSPSPVQNIKFRRSRLATPQPKRMPLAILHRDALQRSSQRSRWQIGELNFNLFKVRQSACIRCSTCGEMLSVKRFLKHMHHQNNRDELAQVTFTQVLEMHEPETASAEDHATWNEFEQRKAELQVTPVRKARVSGIKSPPSSIKVKMTSVKAKSPVILKPASKSTLTPKPIAKLSVIEKSSSTVGKPAENISVNPSSKSILYPKLTAKSSVTVKSLGRVNPTKVSMTIKSLKAISEPTDVMPKQEVSKCLTQEASVSVTKNNVELSKTIEVHKSNSPSERPTAVAPQQASSPTNTVKKPISGTITPMTSRRSSPLATGSKSRSVGGVSTSNSNRLHVSPNPVVEQAQTDSNPQSSIRHSTRVRKQKQLHPIERYVFSGGVTSPASEPPAKRLRLSNSHEPEQFVASPVATNRAGVHTPTGSPPIRKVRLRLSTAGATGKYDLRASPESTTRQ